MARLPSSCLQLPFADCAGVPSMRGERGIRTVDITTTSSRNIAASMEKRRVNEPAFVGSTR